MGPKMALERGAAVFLIPRPIKNVVDWSLLKKMDVSSMAAQTSRGALGARLFPCPGSTYSVAPEFLKAIIS